MALEIERKFLVTGDAWRSQVTHSVEMHQGYLASEGGRSSVRVRIEGLVAKFNIKAAVLGVMRAEYEYDMPLDDVREILATLCVGQLQKIRHYIKHTGLVWEIDEFSGKNSGLVIAEVELTDLNQAVKPPDWVGKEVTAEQRYYNHHLALHPFSTWPDAYRN